MKKSFVFNIKKFFSSLNKMSKPNKVLGIMALFILSVGIIIPLTGISYAVVGSPNTWLGHGYSDNSPYSSRRGWSSGYGYVHIAKCPVSATQMSQCSTPYSSTKITVTNNVSACSTTGTTDCWNRLTNNEHTYFFSADSTSNIQIGNSSTSSTIGLNLNSSQSYIYTAPTFKVKIPKGYYVYNTYTAYNTTVYSNKTMFRAFETGYTLDYNYDIEELAPGPYASDTWWPNSGQTGKEGYLGVDLKSVGMITNAGQNSGYTDKHYRNYESYNIALKPNKTTIKYNCTNNGGTGSLTPQTKIYDQALTVYSSGCTKNEYSLANWSVYDECDDPG